MPDAEAPTPQQVANHVREGMFRNDRASKWLGLQILEVAPTPATPTTS